ncbi:hypothetical protein ACIP93_27960 [Streptomyces sp. NPDC088745]|uniref:hypothetical protein n=1 Tax=Streptomyces sp. NPDC088745 TaxID=3365884 RepID=UPI00382928D6
MAAQHPDPDIPYLPLTGALPAVLTYASPRSDPHPFGRALRKDRTAERAPARPDLPEARLTAPAEA